MVGSLLGGSRRSRRSRRSSRPPEGNPLFIEELVAALGDEAAGANLPATVRAAIAARIDALPPDARTALLHASRDRAVVLARRARRDRATWTTWTRRWKRSRRAGSCGAVAQSQVEGDVEFAFKHVLIRDVAYATLPSRAPAGAALGDGARDRGLGPRSDGARLDPRVPLARRWRARPSRSSTCVAAGDRARAAMAVEETHDFYSRALELADTDEDRRRSVLRRGIALAELEQYSRADKELAALIPELDGRDEIEAILRTGAVDVLDRAGGGDAVARPASGGARGGERREGTGGARDRRVGRQLRDAG